ncbi:HAMP domain-containing histidine kinase [Brevibacillus sp. M2.1A]|uniref:HAMP domain-containing sensor histidine kinase n=1 Tax=Brevibacillus TaxID=55080 RepID=UPI00156A7755|nr:MULTISPECIES: HAMP domain-containing sensor histidine kinase [Brevibacillus]MBY0085444.1 HAMP domain-containing histidine kinase [Brevibacillus brevis]MCC8434749.1 HAMP domain-containing histidine kinase [Brevibacillus sp. M2.1A]MCE0450512.1 HAMP domain-containing histidine kinase [Brevibacillus sp. AF8]UKK97148.1 HAMP domain-containing histidine kinase [Brevibacillus brevis]
MGINSVFIKNNEPVSLLRYWTTRYLLTLVIGLLIIGAVSAYWIKYAAIEKQIEVTRLFAEEVADRVVDDVGNILVGEKLHQVLDNRRKFMGVDRNLILFIEDVKGKVVYSRPTKLPPPLQQAAPELLEQADKRDKVRHPSGETLYVIRKNLEFNDQIIGKVILLFPETDIKVGKEEIQYLVIMLGSLGVLGWAVIYFHARKLSEPIQNVVMSARQIVEGNYDVLLNKTIKEKEIHELVHTFAEMADRLRQLESMRTELLAGVTHELKTPVTSISGLIQAINDEVVSGEEQKEFLEICLKETKRLQKMVEDLLDFNSFAVGAITVCQEEQNVNKLIREIASQWQIVHDLGHVTFTVRVLEKQTMIYVDPGRVQQILINLLNNAKQAVGEKGNIALTLYKTDTDLRIDVKDDGPGIPAKEQPLVFERFFRGSNKKDKVRGLGLGLSYSRMMAKALGGDLLLAKSTSEGSVFTLILPMRKDQSEEIA